MMKRMDLSVFLVLCFLLGFQSLASDRLLVDEPAQRWIYLRKNKSWTLPPYDGNGRVTAAFEHRIDFPRLGGWAPCWQLLVNDVPVTPMGTRKHPRLLNKPLTAVHMDHGTFSVSTGAKWYSLYSPDYELAKKRFYPVNPRAYQVEIDITNLLSEKKENRLTIRFGSELSGYYKSLGLKRKPALVVRNFKIIHSEVSSLLPPLEKPVSYVVMKDVPRIWYECRSEKGKLDVCFGALRISVRSSFSEPGGKSCVLDAAGRMQGKYYSVSRKLLRRRNRIDVFDTYTSCSQELIGIRIDHDIPLGEFGEVYVAGDPVPSRSSNAGGRNPSVFLSDRQAGQGIALIAQDDVFRVQNIQYCTPEKAGIRTDSFALSPGESRTVEWSIYPVMSADYFDFINEVRRDWQVNFTIQGGFHLSMNCFRDWSPAAAQKFHRDAGLAMNTFGVLYWQHLGKGFEDRNSGIHGAALMDEKVRGGVYPRQLREFEVEPMRQFIRQCLASAGRAVPDLKRLIYVHNQISSEIGDSGKYASCALTRADGRPYSQDGNDYYHYFVPTADNAYGRRFMKFLKYLLDEFDLDGIYHDEFTYTRSMVTYNMWDGVSVELDRQGNVKRKIGFVPLLKLQFNMDIMEYVLRERRKVFVANFSPETRSERKYHFPRFEETYNSWWIYLSHLYTPIQLGDMLTYGVTREDMMADVANALKNGALYYHYNNQSACPTITAKMYPFTPVELHSGWLVGKERILTIHSGEYGWKGENALCIPWVYDGQGFLQNDYPAVFTDSLRGTVCRLRLKNKYMASLEKIPVAAELPEEVSLSELKFEDGLLSCTARGTGEVKLTSGRNTRKFMIEGSRNIRWKVR